jgi:hypothetical protein
MGGAEGDDGYFFRSFGPEDHEVKGDNMKVGGDVFSQNVSRAMAWGDMGLGKL